MTLSDKKISISGLISAEKTASEHDWHISRAIAPYLSETGEIEVLNVRKVFRLVKKRPENSHKGSFGKLVSIVGSDRFCGAAQLSTMSALRCGVGLITVVTTKSAATSVAISAKEATLLPIDSDQRGFISPDQNAEREIIDKIRSADAVLFGCGVGISEKTLNLLTTVIENSECPIILDADGINLLSGRIELLRRVKTDLILTPHPAELSRLANVEISEALSNRAEIALSLSNTYNCTVVAKSASTLIASSGKLYLSVEGNNGLARGGSGDMLAGIIASFCAQGYQPAEATVIGAVLSGKACELCSKKISRRGMLPTDAIGYLPELFKKIERLI